MMRGINRTLTEQTLVIGTQRSEIFTGVSALCRWGRGVGLENEQLKGGLWGMGFSYFLVFQGLAK